MEAAARIAEQQTGALQRGTVVQCQGKQCTVDIEGELWDARPGFSCAYLPEPGDLVLVSLGERTSYILDILERFSDNPAQMRPDNGLEISTPENGISLRAGKGLDLQSQTALTLGAPLVELSGSQVSLTANRLSILGKFIYTQAERIKNSAVRVENLISRLQEKLLESQRKVEGLDLVQAAHISREATDLYSSRSAYTVMSCDQDMKVDARHIHLG